MPQLSPEFRASAVLSAVPMQHQAGACVANIVGIHIIYILHGRQIMCNGEHPHGLCCSRNSHHHIWRATSGHLVGMSLHITEVATGRLNTCRPSARALKRSQFISKTS